MGTQLWPRINFDINSSLHDKDKNFLVTPFRILLSSRFSLASSSSNASARRAITIMQSSTAAPPLLLSPASLSSLLAGEKKPRILDATWFMPGVTRNAGEEFTEGPRLPNSSFWDVEDVADRNHPLGLKHMMPRPETFAEASCTSPRPFLSR